MSAKEVEDFDKLCNAGFKKLDELRLAGMASSPEYLQQLKELQTLTRKRKEALGLDIILLR